MSTANERINQLRKKYGIKTQSKTDDDTTSSRIAALREKYGLVQKSETAQPPSVPVRETLSGESITGTAPSYAELADMTLQERLARSQLGQQEAAKNMLKDAGYVGERFGLGVATGLEGLADAAILAKAQGLLDSAPQKAGKAIADLLGIRKKTTEELMAEDLAQKALSNQATAPWQASIEDRYDPNRVTETVGEISQTIGNMAPSIAGNILLPGIGIPVMGVSAGGQGAQQAYQETADLEKATLYGMATGGLEAGTELLFGGLAGLGKGVADTAVGKAVKKAASALGDSKAGKVISGFANSPVVKAVADSLGEGVEEVIATYLDPFLQRVIYNPNAQNATAEELLQSGLMGMLVGGVFQVGNAALGGLMGEGYVPPEQAEPDINEMDAAPVQTEQDINAVDNQSEQTHLSNKQVERMIRDDATMQEMGIDTNGKTMSQLRNEVRARMAAQEQGTETSSEENMVQTPAEETALRNDSVVSQEEASRRMSAGEAATAVLGENGAKAFRTAYNQDVASRLDEQTAATGFNTVYKATLDGRTMTAEERAQTASLPSELKMAAESSARLDRQRASQAKYFGENAGVVRDNGFKQMHLSSKTVRTLDAAAKVAGVQVRFVEQVEGGDAYYKDGIVLLSMKSENPVTTLFTHEIVHRIRETSPQSYNAMAEFVQKYMSETAKTVNAVAYASAYETSDVSFYTEEMVADAFGTILRDGKAMERFVQDNRTAAQKVLDAIRDFVNAIKRAMNHQNVELSAEQRKAFRDLESQLSEMEKVMESALKSIPSVQKENAAPEGSVVRFSTKSEALSLSNVDWMDNFSSIKDQLAKHADELNGMQPVVVVEYTPKSAPKLVATILGEVSKIGGKTMKNDGVSFEFDEAGVQKINAHAKNNELRAAALASPYVAKYGKLIAGQKNHENTGLTTLTYGAPAIINGNLANVGVAIQFKTDGRPRAVNVGLQSGGVFKIDITKAPKGLDSRISRYGQGTALPTMDAFNESVSQQSPAVKPESGRQSKRIDPETRREAEEAVARYVEQYGAIPPGENPARVIEIPRRTERSNKVSQTVRTILEAGATPDEMVPDIEKLVADGKLSYNPISDESAVNEATAIIERDSWDTAQRDWFKAMGEGVVSKANTTMGWLLYNNAANSGNTKLALDILNEMVKSQRSAAQALQATRILKTLSPETQLYGAQKSVEGLTADLKKRYGDDIPDLKIDPALAEKFLNARTDKGRTEAMQEIYRDIGRQMPSRFIDKFNAWRYLAMLGNPRTHVRNIVGNAGFAPVVAAKNLTATAIERVVLRNSDSRTKSVALATKEGRALLKAAWADYANVTESMPDGKYSDHKNANRYIEEGRVIFGRGEGKTAFGRVLSNTAGKLTEKVRRFNSGALAHEDMWFAKPHYASALAQYCKAHGITVEELHRGTSKRVGVARNYAMREAQKATYQDANEFSEFFSRLGRNPSNKKTAKAMNALVEGVLPFRKTPANILVRSVEYSPLGLVRGLKNAIVDVRKGNVTASEAIDRISSGLTGTALLGLGVWLAAEGLVRGHGDDEKEKEKDFTELQGHQGYALELPDGTSITLDWLAPEALPFFIGVNLWEMTSGMQDAPKMGDILGAVSNVSEPLLEMSCLQGLNDLLDSVGYASSEGLASLPQVLISSATSLLTQMVPTLLGQIERTGEPVRMTTYTDKNIRWLTPDMQYFIGKVSARLPGFDYNQIPYIDAWGRTESNGGPFERAMNNFLNPAYMSEVRTSAMEQELERLYNSVGETELLPSRAPKSFTVAGEDIDLTAEQYVEYASFRGQRAYDLLSELTESRRYSGLDDKLKASAVKKCYSVANEEAKALVSEFSLGKFHQSMDKAEAAGISGSDYILFYVAVSELKQDQVRAWLNRSGYTNRQKQVLWSTKYSSAY